ncbi:response regulator [Thermodesulfobacteriota bacterium]
MRKSRILIVDDTADTVELLKKRFRCEGYETIEAYDGEEALAKVKTERPDLIVLDVMMPKMDGSEVCESLRADEEWKYIPIIMLTAKSEIPDKIKGLDIGADDYITKPFNYKELAARVRSLLAKSQASQKMADDEKSEALDQIVDEIAHEIRNPMVAIGGFARRISKSLPADDPNCKYLDIILQNVVVLEKMVRELVGLKSLALSKMEPVNLQSILENSLLTFTGVIQERKIEVVTELMDDPPLVLADVENLSRVFANIIENAIEAMDGETRKLSLHTQFNNDSLEIKVCDSGKGISQERIKYIFDPFVTSKTYGPGLGLTFTLKTIRSHKGMISVNSEEGKGTCFMIQLPVR